MSKYINKMYESHIITIDFGFFPLNEYFHDIEESTYGVMCFSYHTGNFHFNNFIGSGRCGDDCLLHAIVPHDAICLDNMTSADILHIELTANESDTYYIITSYSR